MLKTTAPTVTRTACAIRNNPADGRRTYFDLVKAAQLFSEKHSIWVTARAKCALQLKKYYTAVVAVVEIPLRYTSTFNFRVVLSAPQFGRVCYHPL